MMIIDVSDSTFKDLLKDEQLFLPIRWNGSDFSSTLNNLFNYYIKKLEKITIDNRYDSEYNDICIEDIKKICGLLNKSVDHYLNGFPSRSYLSFKQAMSLLMGNPLKIYQKVL